MPRDGSGIYSQPFPDVVEGTTIESAVYNGFTHDVEIDLNTPRPISSGGTGATNPADAMAALGGEGSKIEVLNYDSHNFTAGSFYSKASASNPPVLGHAFAGICYVAVVSGIATSDMFIEVRDRDEATQPGSLYVRQKKNGTWSGWLKAVGTSTSETAPASPTDGMFWWDRTRGKLFVWYSDPNTAQWVEAVAMPDMNPDDFVRIDAPQTLTETQKTQARSNIYAAPFDAMSYNGMQINGSFDISQELGMTNRGTDGYACDGWRIDHAGTMVQSTGITSAGTFIPGFSNNFASITMTAQASIGAGDYAVVTHNIEGYRTARLGWGTAAAQPIVIGFWSWHTRPGVYSVGVRNAATNRAYFTTYTHNVGVTPEYKIVTIPGDTSGTWATDNTKGMQVIFALACGTTFSTPTANTWTAGNYLSAPGQINAVAATTDIFRLTGVVVLPGIEAPSAARSPLIMRPYDQELLTCQRYYELATTSVRFNAVAGGHYGVGPVQWKVEKRAIPTATVGAPTQLNVGVTGTSGLNLWGCRRDISSAAAGQCYSLDEVIFADARL